MKPLTRAGAMTALLANVFVMPGVGTWMTGQRTAAVVQATASMVGVLMMVAWVCWFVTRWIQQEQMPQNLGPFAWVAGAGMVMFGAAWLWSVASSITALRAVITAREPAPPTPPKLD